jgi:thymidylate synthase
MEFSTETLDDALAAVYLDLLQNGAANAASRGTTKERIGVLITIAKPRARLSRSLSRGKPFSALGELLWYLSRSNSLDFIRRYVKQYEKESEDGLTVHGAYGPRLFAMRGHINQIENVIKLLAKKDSTRRAVIQLFNAEDIDSDFKEIPCTTTMQFLVRDNRLNMVVTLRSNDAFKGLPHDVFCFTMLQEMVAVRLGKELGDYKQFVGSMHLYSDDFEEAQAYLDEGFHRPVEMPAMPTGDPFKAVPALLDAERNIRQGRVVNANGVFNEAYWADLVRLLEVFDATGDVSRINALKAQFMSPIYQSYLDGRLSMRRRKPDTQTQPGLGL